MHCSTCDSDVRPVQEIQPGRGMVDVCPKCTSALAGAPTPAPALAVVEVTHRAPRKAKAAPTEPKPPKPARSIVEVLRAKLTRLDAKIAAARLLEDEARQLRRMIAAAESPRLEN